MRLIATTVLLCSSLNAVANEWSGNVAVEYRYFADHAIATEQHENYVSLSAQPEWFHEWDGGRQSFTFVPFIREDQHDDERSHSDIRELTWLKAADDWELRVGIRKVFWGVTESVHLVDIVNQTDYVEDPDGEEKLGQPMVNLSLMRDWGTLDLFMLPGFRERTFPGEKGRLRSQPVTVSDESRYESGAEETHVDFAIRWSQTFGDWDLGLSQFWGTSRDPERQFAVDKAGNPYFIPYYPIISQTGVDVQHTSDHWLWKFELISRDGWEGGRFTAAAGGFEYTLYGLFGSWMDLGLLAEYLYNDADNVPVNPFEDDLFLGARLTWNDAQSTELLAGVIGDIDTSARYYSLEFSRRLGDSWKLSVDARIFDNIPAGDFLYSLHRDDYIQIELAKYF